MSQIEMVIRTEGMCNSYGLGEVVVPGVALFRAGNYNLTYEQLQAAIKKQRSAVIKENNKR